MASRSDIEAGRAFITTYVKNSQLTQGLKAAQQGLQGFGSQVAAIGAGITAMGVGLLAPFGAALGVFTSVGSELADVSARTGLTASSLAELKFAAVQSGSGLSDVEAALRNMAKKGLGTDIDAQAAKIAAIQDPAARAKAAIEAFGKSGTKLLPMLQNLQALRKEAREAGLVPTDEAVSMADALGDAFDKVRAQGTAALFEIGAAVAPMLLPALQIVSNIASAAINWVRQNGAIFRTVAAVGAALVVAGTAVTGIGVAIFGLGSALGAAASALVSIAGVVAAIVSPVGLIVVGLTAAAAGWLFFTQSGRTAAAAVRDAVLPIVETIKTAVGGIGDALLAGKLELAGQIALTGLQLVFAQGLDAITGLIGGKFGEVIGDVAGRLIQGDLAGAWKTVVASMASLWAKFGQGVVNVFATAANAVTEKWKATVKSIGDALLEMSAGGGVMGKIASTILGVDLKAEQERADKLGAERARLGFGGGRTDVLGQAKAASHKQIDAMAQPIEQFLQSMQEVAEEQAAAAGANLERQLATGATPNELVERLQKELAVLRKQAAAAKQEAENKKAAGGPPADAEALKRSINVGFSAAGLLAVGGGGRDATLSEIKAVKRELIEANKKLQKQIDKPAGVKITK